MSLEIALAGDLNVNRRVSVCEDDDFHRLVDPIRKATVGFGHLETILHDYDGRELYPAAEAGGTWQRGPRIVAEELAWMGFDIVSTPSNHALDYSYGGLRSTWDALAGAGVLTAGTGETLGDARAPTFLDTPEGRLGVVSMTSSYPPWSRAGEARSDVGGRPGVNPLGYHHEVDPATLESVKDLARTLGFWLTNPAPGEWLVHPPGLHNTVQRFVESNEGSTQTVPDDRDLEGNRRAIQDAAARADLVLAHLHTHAWKPNGDLSDPAAFVRSAAHSCIDAGADLFVAQGSHSPLRGIELYDGCPIFYDPGDFFRMSDTVSRFPTDFYVRYERDLPVDPTVATPSEGLRARRGGGPAVESGYDSAVNPAGGYHTGSVMGTTVPVCSFKGGELSSVELYPGTWPDTDSVSQIGIPMRATGEPAERIVAEVASLSDPFNTEVRFADGRGHVVL